jgi:hypothetical protein
MIGSWPVARLALARCGLLAVPWVRRELRLPPGSPPLEAAAGVAVRWSGEFVPVFERRGRLRQLVGYCRRADGWTSDPRAVGGF